MKLQNDYSCITLLEDKFGGYNYRFDLINKRDMSETEASPFCKMYRYTDKFEDQGFTIRYKINQDSKVPEEPKIVKNHDKTPVKIEKQEQKIEIKRQKYSSDKNQRKIEMTQKQLEELRKYEKVNMKKINIVQDDQQEEEEQSVSRAKQPKKKKYSRAVREGQQQDHRDDVKERTNTNANDTRNKSPQHKSQPIFNYDSYVPLHQIELSRQSAEKKYFKGRVEYGEGPKFRAKIISDEIEGILLIQGKHRNRTLHDDQVYFSVIDTQDDKVNCTVNYIFPLKRIVVGKVMWMHNKGIYVLTPINSRVASMNARPENVVKNVAQTMKTHYFMGQFLGWNKKDDYPQCNIIKEYGKFGDIDVETSSLLKIHNLQDAEYEDDIVRGALKSFLQTLDQKGQYIISDQQIDKREDLRDQRIFTIDPHNSRDFDDAISVQKIGSHFKVGVHIADASFFVQEGSFIDNQARKRTTSVYLVHKAIPMLPRLLCENFCSLNPGKTRLTFTIWIKIDQTGEIIEKPCISRSVIRSKARFTYQQAQKIFQGTITDQKQIEQGFGCVKSQQFDQIARDILTLNEISRQLRKRRVQRGSLFFEIPRKVFNLDQNRNPVDFCIYQRKQAHFLVEQLMILANQQIGQILVRQIGAQTLLRRHKYPGPVKIQRFEKFMKKIGTPLKILKDTRVQDQVNSVLVKEDIKQVIKDIIKYETISLLEAADYFIVGESDPSSWIHYALNSPVYTHFTSPIRRYADILVHRQLASILNGKSNLKPIPKELIDACNQKKLQAKRVSHGCEKIFMCLYLRKSEVIAKGIICEAQNWGIKICVPRFDFKGTLRFQQIPNLQVSKVEEDLFDRRVLKIKYKYIYDKKQQDPMNLMLKEFQEITVKLQCKEGFPLDYLIRIAMPHPKAADQLLFIQ